MFPNRFFLFFLFLLVWSFLGVESQQQLHPDEVVALKEIASTLGVEKNQVDLLNNSLCRQSKPSFPIRPAPQLPNSENNLTCRCDFPNSTFCHVVSLYLKSYSLPGILPPELAKLRYLEEIDFTRNCLTGTIPQEWTSIQFKFISLTGNNLSGEIPKFLGSITSLKYLSFEANQFSGKVPEELGKLAQLTQLIFSSNRLVGQLPTKLADLRNLRDFRTNDNNLSGPIPEFIGNWTLLERLEICGSGLQGPIPSAISRLENLMNLRITDLSGAAESRFPDALDKFTNLEQLILRNCKIYGEIPDSIWTNGLKTLDVGFNKLTGKIPNSTNVKEYVVLTGNSLSGNVSESFFDNNKANVDLSYNNLTWEPKCPDDSTRLNTFRSSSVNKGLRGLLPCLNLNTCSKLRNFLYINCGGEDVRINETITYEGDGEFDSGAANTVIKNNYWGFSSTGDFKNVNREINSYIMSSAEPKLLMKDSRLYTTARLSPLSLTYFGFCLQNGSYTVKLHFAEILFTSDKTYNSLGKRLFDIYIQGRLVRKDFNIMEEAKGARKEFILVQNVTAVTDNTLEIRLYWAAKGTTCIPMRGNYGPLISAISVNSNFKPQFEDNPNNSNGRKRKTISIVAGVVASLLCLILLVSSLLWWKGYLGGKNMREKDLRGLDLQTGSFTLRQIKAATNNFDSANKIGEGGFGSVYKGELSDGTVIAVKQLSSKSKQGNREFVTEIGMISGLQHPNLVKLHGCCVEGNQLLLVYEYMENNSLARALFGPEETQLNLDWATRHKICVEIARGLAFLHEESILKIVHRDIKATNILLDRDLSPKISDFGLAKLDEEENTHISTRIAGTIGYMAPEYALWGHLTFKADVYSFGVVALEIVSGKNNTNYRPMEECVCLLDWAFVLQQRGRLLELVDPKLGSNFNGDEVTRMIKVALLCTNSSPALRPTMSAVVGMLEGQTIIQEVISDPGPYGDDMRFKGIREHYQQMQDRGSSSGSQTRTQTNLSSDGAFIGSTSTSAQDLYPPLINFESESH